MSVSLDDIPNSSSSGQIEIRDQESPFGDGYTSVLEQLNPLRENWDVVFGPLTLAQGATLVTFFRTNRGVTPVTWTPPGEASALTFRMRGPLRRTYNGASMTVGFTLKQIYDNV